MHLNQIRTSKKFVFKSIVSFIQLV